MNLELANPSARLQARCGGTVGGGGLQALLNTQLCLSINPVGQQGPHALVGCVMAVHTSSNKNSKV